MCPKEGSKIELQRGLSDFVRFVRFSGLDFPDFSDLPISAIFKQGHCHKSHALVRENVKTCENL